MAETVMMPKLGFDMAEGTLVRWVKGEGEAVNKGEVLAEIETDKATVEVESSFSGIVARHLVEQGAVVPVGDPIAIIGAEGEKVDEGGAPEKKAEGENVDTDAAAEKKADGEPAPAAQNLDHDKQGPVADTTEQKPVAGSVPAAEIAPSEVQSAQGAPKSPPEQYAPNEKAIAESKVSMGAQPVGEDSGMMRASPLARRLAAEKNLDLAQIKGTGPGGRIIRKDVEEAVKAPRPAAAPSPAPAPAPSAVQAAPAAPKTGVPVPEAVWGGGQAPEDETIPLDKLRATIGRRMKDSKQNFPHFYVTSEYDVAALLELRKQVNDLLAEDQKISVNDFIIKAVALTLRQFPNLNATLKENAVVRYGHINIGVAVALDNGLMTVVCQDADQKPLRVISSEMKEMVVRARQGKVRMDDIEGSTFSISNMGMYDVEHFLAIINPPEAAILAVGSAAQVPVVVDGELKVGTRMKATISADHRVTDGAEAARFMQALKAYLENPVLMMV